jgi:ATP-dependent exoDNAse (exonuclease V) alpha subunit
VEQDRALTHWREAWAEHVNGRLAQLDIDARIDHRSLEAQGIDLEPQNKIGPAAARMAQEGLVRERLEEHFAIARSNGEKILENPGIALDAITHQQATFTSRDLATFVHRHSEGRTSSTPCWRRCGPRPIWCAGSRRTRRGALHLARDARDRTAAGARDHHAGRAASPWRQ